MDKGLKYTENDLEKYCDIVKQNQEACEQIEDYTDTQKILKRKFDRETVNRISMFNTKKAGKACFYHKEKLSDKESGENTIREETESNILKTSRSSEQPEKDDSNKRLKMEIKPVFSTETTII